MNYQWQTPFRLAFELLAFVTGWILVAVVVFIAVATVLGLVAGVIKTIKKFDVKKEEQAQPLLGVVDPTPTMNMNLSNFHNMNSND